MSAQPAEEASGTKSSPNVAKAAAAGTALLAAIPESESWQQSRRREYG
jgi:hypothetical protein